MAKKAQGWGVDVIVAFIAFISAIVLFYTYSINYFSLQKDEFSLLKKDGEFIMENLLSEGYPSNWTQENVLKIGLLSNGRIDEQKLERFYNFTQNDYEKTKNLFLTKYDYFFTINNENITISSGEITGIGKPGTVVSEITSKNLIKIKRFSIYNEKPATVYLYLWEEE